MIIRNVQISWSREQVMNSFIFSNLAFGYTNRQACSSMTGAMTFFIKIWTTSNCTLHLYVARNFVDKNVAQDRRFEQDVTFRAHIGVSVPVTITGHFGRCSFLSASLTFCCFEFRSSFDLSFIGLSLSAQYHASEGLGMWECWCSWVKPYS